MDISGVYYCSKCMLQMESEGICPHCGYDPDQKEIIRKHLEEGCFLNDRYLLGAVIGSGGFGITYAAWDTMLETPVAIKEYFPRDFADRDVRDGDEVLVQEKHETEYKVGLRRFIQESRVLAMFNQVPGIVNVSDCFEENETFYFVMEYVRGVSLDAYVQEHKPDSKQLLDMMRSVIDALDVVHAQGILHRDITPKNLMVLDNGSVKLIDFGSARKVDREGSVIIVTEHYAPVEQYDNMRQQGPWTDIYSLCATMYEMITGEVPPEALVRKHRDELKLPSALGVHLKKYQERALMSGLAVEPDKRIRSIAELRSRLYNLPLPEEIRRRKAFVRKMSVIGTGILIIGAMGFINFTVGFSAHDGLRLALFPDGWYVKNYISSEERYAIPESIWGIPVVQIEKQAFDAANELTEIEIPGSINEIAPSAFFDCPKLTSVRMNEGTRKIDAFAFAQCPELYEVFLPASLETIDETAFSDVSERLFIWGTHGTPAAEFAHETGMPFADREDFTVEELEDGSVCITDFDADNNPNIWSDLTYHSDGEGYYGSIIKLVFPDYIDGKPVSDIGFLRAICIADIETIVYPKGLKDLDDDVNTAYTKHVVVGDEVETISYGAFSSSIIEEICLPDSVAEIGDSAFRDTEHLREIELPVRLAHIGENAFYGSGIRNIKIPDAVVEIGQFAFFYSDLESVHLSSNMDKIESSTFARCKNLKDVYIPEGIESIEVCAFASCTALEYLALPEGLTTIDYHAFEDCYRLKSIYIPASTVDIDPEAFWGCSPELVIMGHAGSAAEDYAREMGMKFENADLWPEVTSAEAGDFSVSVVVRYPEEEELAAMGRSTDEMVLPSYYMGRPVTSVIAESRFDMKFNKLVLPMYLESLSGEASSELGISYNDELKELEIRSDFHSMEKQVLAGCDALTTIVLPDSIETIGESAFWGCRALEEIRIPDGVTRIGDSAFEGCVSLKSVSLPDALEEIGSKAFADCTVLEKIVLPDRVRFLDEACFRGSGLKEITLFGVSNCNAFFQDCKQLERVVLEAGCRELECSFEFCTSLKEVILPSTITDINECTFMGCENLTDLWIYARDFDLWSYEVGHSLNALSLLEEEQEILPEYFLSDSPNVTIHGYADSYADYLARNYELNFEPISESE